MNHKLLNRIFAAGVFLFATITYLITVQPNVSFWDCGEFIASAFYLQVPHPPGTPFFLILGRLFALLPIGTNVAFKVNLVSVLSSGFTVMFLYLTAVQLIKNFTSKENNSLSQYIGTYIAAAIGALSLAFSDTFWFNAVEAEVYALATFFIAFVVWMMMVWHSKADEADNEKYLLMIAYIIGISTGVHLMSVLAIVPIMMVIMFRKYVDDESILKNTAILFVVHSAIIILIAIGMWASQSSSVPEGGEAFKEFDKKMIMIFGAASLIFMGIFWKKIFQKNSFYLPIFIGGVALVATYPGIVKYFPKYLFSIGGDSVALNITIIIAVFAGLGYLIYWSSKNKKETLHMLGKMVLFVLVGYTTYAMIIIRANQDPPINLNSPKTSSEVMSYLNREQYGDFPIFKRRYTQEAHQQVVFRNYSSDLDFFWTYQMNHMFNRYLLWNYAGRSSTTQDSGVDWSKFFGIPFFLGLLGLYYHFRKDWKMASIFLVMFIFLGWLTAFYQNQQQPQPRERDYFYVGAFFVFSIWIALGVRGLLELVSDYVSDLNLRKYLQWGLLGLALVFVPINMLQANFWEHDRSRNYVPWDYSYNLLQSVEPNAIMFTNGDNDTFPLWYLQDVEGVRRDVRIANLSLLNTGWYVKQLKNNEPYPESQKIAMSMTDRQLDELRPQQFEPRKLSLNVTPEQFAKYGITDTSIINKGKIEWVMPNSLQFGDVKAVRGQDLAVLSILLENEFNRPVYFAVTVADDSRIGLDDYLIMEGLAYKVTPKKRTDGRVEMVNAEIMAKQLLEEPEGYSSEYAPGFKFRGLNDSSIFMDSNHTRLVQNYRNSFFRLVMHYIYDEPNDQKIVEVLDAMEAKMPHEIIPLDYRLMYDMSNFYYAAGEMDKAKNYAMKVERQVVSLLQQNPRDLNPSGYNKYQMLIRIYDNFKEYSKALALLESLQKLMPNDRSLAQRIEEYRQLVASQKADIQQESIPTDTTGN